MEMAENLRLLNFRLAGNTETTCDIRRSVLCWASSRAPIPYNRSSA